MLYAFLIIFLISAIYGIRSRTQNGGAKGFPFGKKRFQNIIKEYHCEEMADQQEVFLNELDEYQNEEERNDDVTFIGLKI